MAFNYFLNGMVPQDLRHEMAISIAAVMMLTVGHPPMQMHLMDDLTSCPVFFEPKRRSLFVRP